MVEAHLKEGDVKPDNLLYGLDDKPPALITAFLGLQHVSIIAIAFVFPLLLVREVNGTTDQATFLISMSMMAGGIGVIVQALRKGPVGSGYLCPQVCGPSFLTASIMCIKTGGLPLIFGMTAFAGVVEAIFSRFIHKLRVLFPAEITGLIVAMVGITVIKLAGKNFLALDPVTGHIDFTGFMVGLGTLVLMVGLNVWSKGKIKLFCILIGMFGGYVLAFSMGILSLETIQVAMDKPAVWFPFAYHPGWSFDTALVIPMAIAVLCSSLKSVGDLTTCQKINDTEWKRPDLKNIQKGILADAVGCISAGVLGGLGQSTSSTNIGLSIATGATSRIIAFSTGAILIGLAFFPKLAGIFAVMPGPVVGATLIFALGFMVVAGFQIVMSRMIDARKTFVIGLSIIFGLMVDLIPGPFRELHPWLAPVFSSSLSTATISAVVLNLIFRIGIKSKETVTLDSALDTGRQAAAFMDKQGAAWGARPEVVKKAAGAIVEYLEAIGQSEGDTTITASFDEFNLDVRIEHDGQPPAFPDRPPTPDELLEEGGAKQLAGYLVKSWADRVDVKTADTRSTATLHFEH